MYLLGVDVGTSGCKIGLFDLSGRLIQLAQRAYGVRYPKEGWIELDAEMVYKRIVEGIAEVCADGRGNRILSLAVSSQGEAIIPVDAGGHTLYNAVVTFDTRNKEEYARMMESLSKSGIMRITGQPIHTMFSITKIAWFKNKRPDIHEKVWKYMCFGDYISFRLGAEPVIDYTMAARTMAFDIVSMQWADQILDFWGIRPDQLSAPEAPGKIIGSVGRDASEETGLSGETKIVTGAHDQLCCALGSGIVTNGSVMDSLGTTESLLCVNGKAVVTDEMIGCNIPCYPYVLSGSYAYLTFLSCCGSLLEWYKNVLLKTDRTFAQFDLDCRKITGPTGIYVLPYFAGSGTPYLDVDSKGIFYGLSLSSTPDELYMAILESTAFEAALNLSNMQRCGIEISQIVCVGGGAKSDLWLQLKADIYGKSVFRRKVSEAGSFGAAMLAGAGGGWMDDLRDAVPKIVRDDRVFIPSAERHEKYLPHFERYKKLYSNNKALF